MPDEGAKRVLPMSNALYDFLRQVVLYWLPAAAAFYFTLASIWGLGYGEQVMGTIAALTILLSVILGISKSSYSSSGEKYDGTLVVDTQDPERDTYSIEVAVPFEELGQRKDITLKVDATHVA